MPNRIIREGYLTSENINKCSDGAENLFTRLMLLADDYGRYYGTVEIIKSHCYPFDNRSLTHVSKMLTELINNNLIKYYTVENTKYLEINKFNQRLRIMKSKFPDPPTNDSGCLTDVSNVRPETKRNEYESEIESETETISENSVMDINEKYTPISELLKKRILERRQQKITPDTIKRWNNVIRLMIERDNRTENDIIILIDECHNMPPNKQGFTWANNILSMEKLREKWNEGKIFIGMTQKNTTAGSNFTPEIFKKQCEIIDRMSFDGK